MSARRRGQQFSSRERRRVSYVRKGPCSFDANMNIIRRSLDSIGAEAQEHHSDTIIDLRVLVRRAPRIVLSVEILATQLFEGVRAFPSCDLRYAVIASAISNRSESTGRPTTPISCALPRRPTRWWARSGRRGGSVSPGQRWRARMTSTMPSNGGAAKSFTSACPETRAAPLVPRQP